MIFGLLMKALNSLFEFKISKLIFVVIPELAFMISSFGYMVFCIVFKWF